MRILILPLACALVVSCSNASEMSLMSTDFSYPFSPVHQRAQSVATIEKPLDQQQLIDAIAQDCLKNSDWQQNLKILDTYQIDTFRQFFKTVNDTDLYQNSKDFIPLETFYRRLLNKLDIVETKIQMKKAEAEGLKLIRPSENLSQATESSSLSSQN